MKFVLKSKLLFVLMLSCLFASSLLGGNAAQAAEKTITAHIEMDSQLGATLVDPMVSAICNWRAAQVPPLTGCAICND